MPRVYLDACCLNRPFDDQRQQRIHLESEAVIAVLEESRAGTVTWISSAVVDLEIGATPDPERRARVQHIAAHANEHVALEDDCIRRGLELEEMGFPAYDALHLACAEAAHADVLLTTDDRLIKLAGRLADRLRIRVTNPLQWVSEVI